MILHGAADNVLPIDAIARRFHQGLPDADTARSKARHTGCLWTHAGEVNSELHSFLGSVQD